METKNVHDPKKLGLPHPIIIKFLDGEELTGTLTAVHPKRMDVKIKSGKTISVYKHAIKYFEEPDNCQFNSSEKTIHVDNFKTKDESGYRINTWTEDCNC